MDILEPVITHNTQTQGRHRLICEKQHNMEIVLRRLETLKQLKGVYEKQLLYELDFTGDYPKLLWKQGVIDLCKFPGHITHATRSTTIDECQDIRKRVALTSYIKEFKMRFCEKLIEEIKSCMSQDSLANAFGALDILPLPTVTAENECYDHDYGKEEMELLGDHFGSKFWVLQSFKDSSNTSNHFMVKPILHDPVLDKDVLFEEFSTARGDNYRQYRGAVLKGDMLTRKYDEE